MIRLGRQGSLGMTALVLAGLVGGGGSAAVATAPDGTVDAAALDQLVAAAQEEGSVDFWSVMDEPTIQRVADGFEADYGITVNHPPRFQPAIMAQRFEEERNADVPTADVLQVVDESMPRALLDEQLVEPMTADLAPGLATYPAELLRPASAVVGITLYRLCYNTDNVDEADVASVEAALVNSELSLVMSNPSTLAYITAIDNYRELFGEDWLEALGDREPTYVDTSVTATQQVAAGEFDMTWPCSPSLIAPLIDQGAPIAEVTPQPAVGFELQVAVSSGAPHPNAARLLVHWLSTIDGQAALVGMGGGGASPVVPEGDEALQLEPLPQGEGGYLFADYDRGLENQDAILAALGYEP